MANINRQWKRFAAVGCSHGSFADPIACNAALAFIKGYDPHIRIHLGDFTDMAAFRGGAAGTCDEAAAIAPDLYAGLAFLEQLEPTILFNGNHEDRLFRDMSHYSAIRSRAATEIVNEIHQTADRLKCLYIDHYDIRRSWVRLGNLLLGHGFMYSVGAIRAHAEMLGTNCLIAHLHRRGSEAAQLRSGEVMGHCVGLLADIGKLSYAKARRATTAWSRGIGYGECCDNETRVWIDPLPGTPLEEPTCPLELQQR